MPPPPAAPTTSAPSSPRLATLAIGALGVVFGDIGTSPLYALQTVFTADNHAVSTDTADIYGVLSLVFWVVTLVVSVKYVTFVMRADNGGEGGIMALTALLQDRRFKTPSLKALLVILGIFGASLFCGDGMITPAISVMSAVEGLKVAAPGLGSFVVPITATLLTLLFLLQRFGTGFVGRLFGPVMGLWFVILAITGVKEIAQEPAILQALSPTYAVSFLLEHRTIAFIALGSVVLVVTGAEALYADMGHFGRPPIRRAWFLVVFPALTLNYLGQGALLLHSPGSVENPFFNLVPSWAQIPMVVLATVATIIASQAAISGLFSVSRQAMQLGFLPRLTVQHTSEEAGQVYLPAVNWALFAAALALVVGFGSAASLASAYGIAVTGTFVLDTVLFLVVMRVLWHKPAWLLVVGALVVLVTELTLLSANLTKVVSGGWVPLLVAVGAFTVLTTWRKGRDIVTRNRTREEGTLHDFVEGIHAMDPPLHRVEGAAVFLNANVETTPLALRANVEHNRVLHTAIVIFSVQVAGVPHIQEEERLTFDDLGYGGDGIEHITARFGFQDDTNIPHTLRLAIEHGLENDVEPESVSYFLSQITIVRTDTPGMRRWQKKMFIHLADNAASPVHYFSLPTHQCISVGAQIEV